GKLAKFLNEYMADEREPGKDFLEEKERLFKRTVDIVHKKIFGSKTTPKLPLSIIEGTLVGVSFNLDYLEGLPDNEVHQLYNKLMEQEEYSEQSLKEGLAVKSRLVERMSKAETIFAGK